MSSYAEDIQQGTWNQNISECELLFFFFFFFSFFEYFNQISYGFAPFPKINDGRSLAILRIVSPNREFAQANHGRV